MWCGVSMRKCMWKLHSVNKMTNNHKMQCLLWSSFFFFNAILPFKLHYNVRILYKHNDRSTCTNQPLRLSSNRWCVEIAACSAAEANARASPDHSPLRTPRCGFGFSQAVRGRPAFIHKVTGLLESTTAPWKRRRAQSLHRPPRRNGGGWSRRGEQHVDEEMGCA